MNRISQRRSGYGRWTFGWGFAALTWAAVAGAGEPAAAVIENAHFRYRIAPNGTNLEFIDRASGSNYLRRDAPSACASVRVGGREQAATGAVLGGDRLELAFGATGVKVVVRVERRPSYVRLRVETVTGAEVERLVFLNVPLVLQGRPEEPFGACALSLNLPTRVDALPALQRDLNASCVRKFGLAGAKVALVGVPAARMLPALKEVLGEAEEMPPCRVAGPWAREVPFNHGSYLFNFGTLTESNVEEWIGMARSLGVTQVDHHGGSAFFRFGDFVLQPEKWPAGWEGYRRIVQRLHDAGIGSIFHSYAFFIDKHSKYVTPVPDRRLDAFRVFTLAAPLTPEATEIHVRESTEGLNTVTGFFEHNSVVLHIDDELVTFGGVTASVPGRFTAVTRGALGTRPAAHAAGASARHLKECFGLFVPDVASSLFEEIARNHAAIVNACGFDGLYLDAIDGSSILRGPDECWYWADKFVFEIQRHLQRPVGMEMSAMWHHFWQYRTRWQAWDYPQRGHKRFIDLHADAVNGGLLLPLHLGWWSFQTFDPPQVEPTYPDVIEYLGAKLIGWDAGISLTSAVDAQRLKDFPLVRRGVEVLRTCEELRRTGRFPEELKARLRAPGQEFTLARDPAGGWRFHPVRLERHTVALAEPWTLAWTVTNPFPAQPLRLRLEALMSAKPYDDPGNIRLDLGDAQAMPAPRTAPGVTLAVRPLAGSNLSAGLRLEATHSGPAPRNAAWARLDRRFEPALKLKQHQALGVCVEGDGSGALLAVRLESPRHLAFGAVADRYLPVDFTGRRCVTLVETESERWSDFVWGDAKGLYNVYRETVDFGAIESVSVWCQNLPPGQATRWALGPIQAMPMVPCTLRNPTLTVGGEMLVFPVSMPSGSFLEANGPNDCVVYGAKGEVLAAVTPRGAWPQVGPGSVRVRFACEAGDGASPRARVVVMPRGE